MELTRDRPCDQTGISHERLHQEGPIQWPCADSSINNIDSHNSRPKVLDRTPKRMYTDFRFNTPDGRARFGAYHSRGLAEPADPNYPFVLTTGRLYGHWHTQTRTGRIEKTAKMHPNPFIEIHPRDAVGLGITDGELLEVRSRRGKGFFPALITKAIAPGTVFVPMHWGSLWADQAEANALTHPEACPDSLQPELKACAVQLLPVRNHRETTQALLESPKSSILSAAPSV